MPELDDVAHLIAHDVGTGFRVEDEEPLQVDRVGHHERPFAVAPLRRGGERTGRHVGGDDLHVPLRRRRQQLTQQHRDRVGLFTGRAAGTPDAKPTSAGRLLQQLRKHVLAKRADLRRVAEEVRLRNRDLVDKRLTLLVAGSTGDECQVGRDVGAASSPHSLAHRVGERVAAGVVEDKPRCVVQQLGQRRELVVRQAHPVHEMTSSSSRTGVRISLRSAGPMSASASCRSTAPTAIAAAGIP